jgi:hypothetical protein
MTLVDLIRGYSNKAYLRDQYADLRKRLQEQRSRPPLLPKPGRTHALKRQVGAAEIDEIIAKYQSGISTNQLITEHHLAKRTISALLRANGVSLRRQGLSDTEATEAADLYIAGRSLAWIGQYFGGISPTTAARVLRNQGVSIRPRPGSM